MKGLEFVKKDGQIVNPEEVSKSLSVVLNMIKNGEYRIVVESVKRQRSLPQNRLLWMWLTILEEQTGQDKESLKDYFATIFLQDEIDINGRIRTVVRGTSKLSKEEMTIFLDKISIWCSENLGITLPSPEDLWILGYE